MEKLFSISNDLLSSPSSLNIAHSIPGACMPGDLHAYNA